MSVGDLRELLLGPPLCSRDDSTLSKVDAALSAHVRAIPPLLRQVFKGTENLEQAIAEIEAVAALPPDACGVTCKRAAVLYAMSREAEIGNAFGTPLARDMVKRVLPFATPSFYASCCQNPQPYVLLCIVLAEMWEGERIGNWGEEVRAPQAFHCSSERRS
jgi:hypothetical protein